MRRNSIKRRGDHSAKRARVSHVHESRPIPQEITVQNCSTREVYEFVHMLANPGGREQCIDEAVTLDPANNEGTSMDKDRINGSAEQAKGAVKETAGKVFGDKKLEIEGKTEKAAGKVQNAVGEWKDVVRGK
jgi:uncharacterized protein YjbJ (UPF0337 family)